MPTIGFYRIVSPTFKSYVGKSINIERRMREYSKGRCKTQPKLYRSIKKYGWDSHRVDIYECAEKDLDMFEIYHISWFQCLGKNGLNCMKGGNGCRRPTIEQRQRMSESKKGLLRGEKNPMWGKKMSEAAREGIRRYNRENKEKIIELSRISSTGRVYSQASKEKKSKSLLGHPVSAEVRDRLRQCRSKPVLQYTIEGVFIKEWESVKIAQLEVGVTSISSAASGAAKQMGGFVWRYKNNGATKKKRPVSKYSISNEFLNDYNSIRDAAKNNRISPSDISQVCLGKGVSAGGFKWKYSE